MSRGGWVSNREECESEGRWSSLADRRCRVPRRLGPYHRLQTLEYSWLFLEIQARCKTSAKRHSAPPWQASGKGDSRRQRSTSTSSNLDTVRAACSIV